LEVKSDWLALYAEVKDEEALCRVRSIGRCQELRTLTGPSHADRC
jgi:hypothetical protein